MTNLSFGGGGFDVLIDMPNRDVERVLRHALCRS